MREDTEGGRFAVREFERFQLPGLRERAEAPIMDMVPRSGAALSFGACRASQTERAPADSGLPIQARRQAPAAKEAHGVRQTAGNSLRCWRRTFF